MTWLEKEIDIGNWQGNPRGSCKTRASHHGSPEKKGKRRRKGYWYQIREAIVRPEFAPWMTWIEKEIDIGIWWWNPRPERRTTDHLKGKEREGEKDIDIESERLCKTRVLHHGWPEYRKKLILEFGSEIREALVRPELWTTDHLKKKGKRRRKGY